SSHSRSMTNAAPAKTVTSATAIAGIKLPDREVARSVTWNRGKCRIGDRSAVRLRSQRGGRNEVCRINGAMPSAPPKADGLAAKHPLANRDHAGRCSDRSPECPDRPRVDD